MSKISEEFKWRLISAFKKYKRDKETLNQRVRENDLWYKARYGKIINGVTNETEPATGFIFSAVENKFADAVDNFPTTNILEREPGDKELTEILSKIVPVQLDIADFKKAYKANWRRKLKYGTGIYGVFYIRGDIKITPLSILNVYCDMHVNDVQESQFLFIVSAVDNDELKERYPDRAKLFVGNANVDNFDGTHEAEGHTEIIDCYYKLKGKVHCIKLCNEEIIDATEDGNYPDGIYKHGLYPVVFDILYPEEDCPFGFGVIDVAKNPQVYIDRLDGAIIKNAILSSKQRFLIKDSGAVNEEEVLDYSNDIVHVAGSVDTDSIRELQVSGLPAYVMNHRSKKIEELKEIVGNRDFQQGGTSGGVTAASAISILQEAGNKLSRSSIDDSYDTYKQIVIIVIELMREFFDEKKVYRIVGDNGQTEYAEFSSEMMYKERADFSNAWTVREPVEFDVSIVPQKQNPFQREANNATIVQLWQAGMFGPQSLDSALIALQAMQFDGKDKVVQQLENYKEKATQQQQVQSGELVPVEDAIKKAEAEEQQQRISQLLTTQQIKNAEEAATDKLLPVDEAIKNYEREEEMYNGN